jgi:hypothetical protein
MAGWFWQRKTDVPSALAHFRQALETRLKKLEEELKEEWGDTQEQVNKRKEFAKSLNLSEKMLKIYDEVKYYQGWLKTNPDRICNVVSDPLSKKENEENIVQFHLNQQEYSFRFKETTFSTFKDDKTHALLTLSGGAGTPLVVGNFDVDADQFGMLVKPLDIQAFIPGDWLRDFLELHEQIVMLEKEQEIKLKYDPAKREMLKKNFGL